MSDSLPLRLRPLLLAGLLLAGLLLTGGCGGGHPYPVTDGAPPMTAYILPPSEGATADGPRLRITVPRSDLVFQREGEALSGGLEVTVVAWREGRQVGGAVSRRQLELEDWAATREDSLFTLELPVVLEGRSDVQLEVRARSLGTSRRWVRRIPCPLTAWTPLPLELVDWSWNADRQGVLDPEARQLRVNLDLVRRPPVPWPADGFGVGLRLASPLGPEHRHLRPLDRAEAAGDTLHLTVAIPADSLPLGNYQLTVGLGAIDRGGSDLQIRARAALQSLQPDLQDGATWHDHLVWLGPRLEDARRRELEVAAPADRPALFASFWPTPGALRAHLLRILEADRRFAFARRGALTDRGLVFVERGEPERIERKGSPGDRFQRWEIWFYGPDGPVFTFLDSHGLGEYRLIRREGNSH